MKIFRLAGLLAFALCIAVTAEAQDWKGMGRVGGKVLDESGKPIDGVTVKAMLPSAANRGPADSTSNSKGEWAVGGIAAGTWGFDFSKEGFETRRIALAISELERLRPIEIVLKKTAVVVDPNDVIKAKLIDAAALMNAKKFAEARAMYEALAAEHPKVKQFKPLIARAYYGEGNKDKAITLLREAAAEDPQNAEVRLLLGTLLNEAGKAEEARTLLATVDETKIVDPVVLLNIGIGIINEGRHADAIPWFDKAIARFPEHPDSYYYRGISYVSVGKNAEAKADLEKFVSIAKPDAPELVTAKGILATIK